MQVVFTWLWVGVAVSLLVPPTLSFSHGASQASCLEMIPGHIRAHSQDPRHSHIILATSAHSYLPGQLVTVTVRSSRDFMGFLLQARRLEDTGFRIRTRGQAKAVEASKRLGPLLVGGSWALTPPSTHTLRCLSEGDTLTHSDKQLKRNLSFVWRAPDAPMGDIQFYMTAVQSYFVYWAGIQSAVVHDGSRTLHRLSNTTVVDGGNLLFEQHEDEITPPTGTSFQIKGNLWKNSIQFRITIYPSTGLGTDSPVTSRKAPIATTSKIHSNTSVKEPSKINNSRPEMDRFVTPESLTAGTNKILNVTSSIVTSSFLQKATKDRKTDTYTMMESSSGMPEEESTETNTPIRHTKDDKSSKILSNLINFSPTTPSFSLGEMKNMKDSSTVSASVTEQTSTSFPFLPNSLTPVFPLKDGKMLKVLGETILNKTENTTFISSTTDRFHNTSLERPITQYPPGSIKNQSSLELHTQNSSLLFWMTSLSHSKVVSQFSTKAQNSKFTPYQSSSAKPFTPKYQLHPQTGTIWSILISETSVSQLFPKSKSPLPKSHLRLETTTSYSSFQSQTNSIVIQTELLSLQTPPKKHQYQTPYQITTDLSQLPHEYQTGQRKPTSPHPQVKTAAPLRILTPPQTLSIFPPKIPTQNHQDSSSQTNQPRPDALPEASTNLEETRTQSHYQTDAPQANNFMRKQSQPSVSAKPFNPLAITLTFGKRFTSDISASIKDGQYPEFNPKVAFLSSTTPAPTDVRIRLHSSSVSVGPLYSSGGSSIQLSSTSALDTHRSKKILKTTPPVITPLISPTPISIPIPSVSVPPSSTTTGRNSSYSSKYPSSAPFLSFIPLSTSSSSITDSVFSSPSSSTISPIGSSTFTIDSSTSSSLSTSTSISSTFQTLSIPFYSSSSPLEPSPAPHHSRYNLVVPSSSQLPDQRTTLGQKLLNDEQAANSQSHVQSSSPDHNFLPRTMRTAIQPKPHPNLKQNHDHEPNLNNPNNDPKPKSPSQPSGAPDKDGKYPDIIPRHSNWELGMLLGCSAGLGMVLVVGLRYLYRQACGKQTEVTLNDREREYGRGERGLVHVQECRDLVKVRRIRENSFVVLAEYDVLASHGD
ncbi:flocculation protein FLO11-like [Thalassophryne amazonica]|uniref:flocculation protein FLO11-like n=1 Tax=Thalassophryne amazonica TaxID=390379 RepID=UPI0014716852|nr:flocculation protein FLO11-like [Thalassophryne amazonica]